MLLAISSTPDMLGNFFDYPSAMKIEAVRFLEKLVNFYQSKQRHVQETVLFTVTAVRTSNLKYFCEILPYGM
jgi:hypothetical protein